MQRTNRTIFHSNQFSISFDQLTETFTEEVKPVVTEKNGFQNDEESTFSAIFGIFELKKVNAGIKLQTTSIDSSSSCVKVPMVSSVDQVKFVVSKKEAFEKQEKTLLIALSTSVRFSVEILMGRNQDCSLGVTL